MDEKLTLYEIQDMKFMTRPKSTDISILQEVILHNFYLDHPDLKIKEGDVILDIGAHIGAFTILAAKLGAIVFAYEPDPSNYKLLGINISLNKVEDKVTVKNSAIMTYSGVGKLAQDKINFGAPSLCDWMMLNNPTIEVPVVQFESNLWQGFETVDFLKMDCEGCEQSIILQSDLSRIKQISIECHIYEDALKAMIIKLENDGFKILCSHGKLQAIREAEI